jgi:hypothetical protein
MNFRDLERLQRRINRVQQVKQPPTLKMLILQENDPMPEFVDDWTLTVKVEGKGENNI